MIFQTALTNNFVKDFMRNNVMKRWCQILLIACPFLLLVAIGIPVNVYAQETPDLIMDFENGESQGFLARGGNEILEVTEADAHSGNYSLKTTGRVASWNGPSIRIEEYIEQGCEYQVTAWVSAISPTSSSFRLSTQVGDGSAANYVNLASKTVTAAQGWVALTGRYRYTNTSSGFITIYIENDIEDAQFSIDDISITRLAGSGVNVDLDLPSLAEIYKDDFLIGGAFSSEDLAGPRFELVRRHYNVLTACNAMKPDALQPTKGSFNFAAIDNMFPIIEDANILLHGHTLAWHNQSSPWLNKDELGAPLTREEAQQNLIEHVQGAAGHYAGKVISWDVLNEAMEDNPANPDDWKSALRRSDWYNAFENGAADGQDGADYVNLLFREARKADPDAKLYYNDYNMDNQNKAIAVANMVAQLNEDYLAEGNSRLLVDGVGMQGHFNMSTNVILIEASLERFIALGVEVSISELDLSVPGASIEGLSEEQELNQAVRYAQLFEMFKKHAPNITRVTFWGLDDGASWRASQFPLLFNSDLSAKQAFYAVADPAGFLAESKREAVPAVQQDEKAPENDIETQDEITVDVSNDQQIPLCIWLVAGMVVVIGAGLLLLRKFRKVK
ncbi:MAG: endo-1,4-beta-xylanase [Acetanaerobacterium sp.]